MNPNNNLYISNTVHSFLDKKIQSWLHSFFTSLHSSSDNRNLVLHIINTGSLNALRINHFLLKNRSKVYKNNLFSLALAYKNATPKIITQVCVLGFSSVVLLSRVLTDNMKHDKSLINSDNDIQNGFLDTITTGIGSYLSKDTDTKNYIERDLDDLDKYKDTLYGKNIIYNYRKVESLFHLHSLIDVLYKKESKSKIAIELLLAVLKTIVSLLAFIVLLPIVHIFSVIAYTVKNIVSDIFLENQSQEISNHIEVPDVNYLSSFINPNIAKVNEQQKIYLAQLNNILDSILESKVIKNIIGSDSCIVFKNKINKLLEKEKSKNKEEATEKWNEMVSMLSFEEQEKISVIKKCIVKSASQNRTNSNDLLTCDKIVEQYRSFGIDSIKTFVHRSYNDDCKLQDYLNNLNLQYYSICKKFNIPDPELFKKYCILQHYDHPVFIEKSEEYDIAQNERFMSFVKYYGLDRKHRDIIDQLIQNSISTEQEMYQAYVSQKEEGVKNKIEEYRAKDMLEIIEKAKNNPLMIGRLRRNFDNALSLMKGGYLSPDLILKFVDKKIDNQSIKELESIVLKGNFLKYINSSLDPYYKNFYMYLLKNNIITEPDYNKYPLSDEGLSNLLTDLVKRTSNLQDKYLSASIIDLFSDLRNNETLNQDESFKLASLRLELVLRYINRVCSNQKIDFSSVITDLDNTETYGSDQSFLNSIAAHQESEGLGFIDKQAVYISELMQNNIEDVMFLFHLIEDSKYSEINSNLMHILSINNDLKMSEMKKRYVPLNENNFYFFRDTLQDEFDVAIEQQSKTLIACSQNTLFRNNFINDDYNNYLTKMSTYESNTQEKLLFVACNKFNIKDEIIHQMVTSSDSKLIADGQKSFRDFLTSINILSSRSVCFNDTDGIGVVTSKSLQNSLYNFADSIKYFTDLSHKPFNTFFSRKTTKVLPMISGLNCLVEPNMTNTVLHGFTTLLVDKLCNNSVKKTDPYNKKEEKQDTDGVSNYTYAALGFGLFYYCYRNNNIPKRLAQCTSLVALHGGYVRYKLGQSILSDNKKNISLKFTDNTVDNEIINIDTSSISYNAQSLNNKPTSIIEGDISRAVAAIMEDKSKDDELDKDNLVHLQHHTDQYQLHTTYVTQEYKNLSSRSIYQRTVVSFPKLVLEKKIPSKSLSQIVYEEHVLPTLCENQTNVNTRLNQIYLDNIYPEKNNDMIF